jgi:predicted AAA+ superfamily ATPase
MIFLQLYRNTKEIFFYKDDYSECDFIICKNGKPKEALQICYSLDTDETKRRELNGLIRGCKSLNLHEGTIITYQKNEEPIKEDGINIRIISAPKYLLA